MLQSYGYIALFMLVAILFAAFMIILPVILRLLRVVPRNPNPAKEAPFECGMETIGMSWVQFNFRYYFYALILIALDIMVVFLYPWAVELKQLGASGYVAALIFIFIIIVGYVYAWRKKVLEWK